MATTDLMNTINSGEWTPSDASTVALHEANRQKWIQQQSTTIETLKKQYAKPNLVRISINLHPEDIEKAKKVAKDLGVPYQVFIRDFIHESLKSL